MKNYLEYFIKGLIIPFWIPTFLILYFAVITYSTIKDLVIDTYNLLMEELK